MWKYPWRQHCGMQVASRTPAAEEPKPTPMPPPFPLDFIPATIQAPPESWNEDAQRAIGMQKLREQLK